MAADSRARYTLKLACDRAQPEDLYRFIQQSLQESGLPFVSSEVADDLKLVAEEWFANVANHGYGTGSEGLLEVELEIGEEAIRVRFRDSGSAFNPLDRAHLQTEHDLSTGGMGLTIIRSLTDAQSYDRDGECNVFAVTKFYNPE